MLLGTAVFIKFFFGICVVIVAGIWFLQNGDAEERQMIGTIVKAVFTFIAAIALLIGGCTAVFAAEVNNNSSEAEQIIYCATQDSQKSFCGKLKREGKL
ncbi:hypothetical protein [Vibrio harveyi]|uniref:hypothetical protein n=1 Tax=Vibrio harveyi TaxID=669 RepID=UPI0018F249BD|nr:hypothetical protein [Vibrio harveyi]